MEMLLLTQVLSAEVEGLGWPQIFEVVAWDCVIPAEISLVNSLRPSDVYEYQWTGSSLVQVMACCLYRQQAITLTSADLLLWTKFSEILIRIQKFSFMKRHLKMSSAKWQPFCSGHSVLTYRSLYKQPCSWQTYCNAFSRKKRFIFSIYFYPDFMGDCSREFNLFQGITETNDNAHLCIIIILWDIDLLSSHL